MHQLEVGQGGVDEEKRLEDLGSVGRRQGRVSLQH